MNKLLLNLVFCFLLVNVYSLDKKRDCKCRIQTSQRIIGGKISHHLDYPWMISLSNTRTLEPQIIRKFIPENRKIVCALNLNKLLITK